MSEQPEEENAEESTKDNSIDQTLRQGGNLPTPEQMGEAQKIINTFPYPDYNEFLRYADRFRDIIASIQTAGANGLSSPISNFVVSFQGKNSDGPSATTYDRTLAGKKLTHEDETNKLRAEITKLTSDLLRKDAESKEEIDKLTALNNKLIEKEQLSHLLNAVNASAQTQLLDNPEFRGLFETQDPCDSYVIAIDLRRSTELMLKARQRILFAEFIMSLAQKLRQIILDYYGVFDKFTGDGILAFFPGFYSEPHSGFRVITAAQECHTMFEEHYKAHRKSFITVLKDVGLGIGIDYGTIQMVQIGGAFTVVGNPVVYACRIAGAKAGQTYLNYPAYEKIFAEYSAYCNFDEYDIEIKHEGPMLAYQAWLNGKMFQAAVPSWEKSKGDNS